MDEETNPTSGAQKPAATLTIRQRVLNGLANLRSASPTMTAEEQNLLEAAERAVHTQGTGSAPAATVTTATATAEATAQAQEIAHLRAETTRMSNELAEAQKTRRAAVLADHKAKGHILPAADKAAETLMASNEEAFVAFLGLNGRVVALANPASEASAEGSAEETITGTEAAATLEAKRDDQTLHTLATARAKKDGIGYSEALKVVARENPALVASAQANLPNLG